MKKLKVLVAAIAMSLVGCNQANDGFTLPGGKAESSSTKYLCDNGDTVTASYINNDSSSVVILDMLDKKILLVDVVAASGSKYVGGELEWWTKGEIATLSNVVGDKMTECKEIK